MSETSNPPVLGVRSRRPRHLRRAHAQPEEYRSVSPAREAHHHHGRERVGQVVARLRHDLRRRTTALRRVAVGIRPAIPGADGEAGRRPYRRHLAGHRHPSEEQHPQSALDRGDDDGDPRLHAAAVRAHRAARSAGAAGARSCARRPKSSRGSSERSRPARGCCWDSICRSLRSPSRSAGQDVQEVDELYELTPSPQDRAEDRRASGEPIGEAGSQSRERSGRSPVRWIGAGAGAAAVVCRDRDAAAQGVRPPARRWARRHV